MFKVVTVRDVVIAILLIVLGSFCTSFLFLSSSFVPVSCDLMIIFSVMFVFLPLFCVFIYYRVLVYGYHEIYI